MERPQFNYGGQAVMEGVMMRGAQIAAIAVRDPEGNIVIHEERLNATLYQGRISKIPFVRGLIGLWDALVLGTRALIWSADIALQEEEEPPKAKPKEKQGQPGWLSRIPFIGKILAANLLVGASLMDDSGGGNKPESAFSEIAVVGLVITSLALGLGLFFALPAAISTWVGSLLGIETRLVVDTIEGVVKLGIFIGYIAVIGLMPDVKRLFGYHGAEHKTINAYEAGAELVPEAVQQHSIEHPRCGTAFLLNVVVLSILVHAITGRPDNLILLIISRILVIPIIAGIAYEIIRFTAKHIENPLIQLMIIPNLALQHLTTRQPDDTMVEVGIVSLQRVLAAEQAVAEGQPIAPVEHLVLQTGSAD